MIKIKQNVLTLKGLTLRSSFQIENPDDILAVIFEVQAPKDVNLCIEPKRGIVMQGQVKNIKVWVPSQDRENVLGMSFVGKSLRINTTMKAEYNRKVMEKLKINGWQKIKNSYQSYQIPIIVSNQVETIRSSLKNQANMASSLHRNELSRQSRQLPISEKLKNDNNEFNVGQSYSLTRPSKINNKRVGDKLDKELDFLFKNQISKIVDRNQNEGRSPDNLKFGEGEMVSYGNSKKKLNFGEGQVVEYGSYNKQNPNFVAPNPEIVTYNNNTKNNQSGYQNNQLIKQQNNQRFLQVIMLAALAGFFAALGSNLKNLLT